MSRLLAGVLLSVTILPLAACQYGGGGDGDAAGVAKAKDAYFASWTIKDGEKYTTERLSKVMDTSPDFLSIDGMAPTPTIDGWKTYEATWAAGMLQFKAAQLVEVKTQRTWAEDDLAATVSEARVTGTMADGTKLDLPAFITLVYKHSKGEWRIVHENTNLPPKH